MKITEGRPKDFYEGRMDITIETSEGSVSAEFGRGEPEDMCLARDLSDAFRIKKMLLLAYEAGKKGEDCDKIRGDDEY
jgi:hypothetical protein